MRRPPAWRRTRRSKALAAAGDRSSEIGLIIVATATPDQTFPATATKVQHALGCNGGIAFDVAAVCSGFLYAMGVADSMLRTGAAKNALVIGAETLSRILDWEDRATCVLFGDGAGAVGARARKRSPRMAPACSPRGSTPTARITNCSMSMAARPPPARSARSGMKGREVFRHAVVNLAEVLRRSA